MFDFGAVQCSVCDMITEGTMNAVPYRGLRINPYTWGGYEEFVDLPYMKELDSPSNDVPFPWEDKYKNILLCHDCSVELFKFLKMKPDWGHHPSDKPGTLCCGWGYDPDSPHEES